MGKNADSYDGFTGERGGPSLYNAVSGCPYENKDGTLAAPAGASSRARPVTQRRSFGITLYLALYNWIAAAAWGYVLFLVVAYFLHRGDLPADPTALYKRVEFPLTIAQGMQIAEILHAVLGFVRSSPFITFTQVFSRVQLGLLLFRLCPRAYSSVGVIALLLAWSAAELIRYPFFGIQALLDCMRGGGAGTSKATTGARATDEAPPEASTPVEALAFLKWLRYSGFIVLYPIGITGEVLCMLMALPELKQYAHYPTPMPNFLNFEVNLYYCYVALLAAYVPGSVLLYSHMLQQRKKCLYGGPATSDDRKKRQ